jgi:hypothetical protein
MGEDMEIEVILECFMLRRVDILLVDINTITVCKKWKVED